MKDDGVIPNSALPLFLCPQVVDAAHPDRASTFEQRFAQNGWTHTWRNGIYSFPHYHSTAHEVLGVACGSARMHLGASTDLLVIGAYPKGQDWDLCRQARSQKELDQIARVPLPSRDPIGGVCGGLNEHWPHA